jgi:hypothetical protein|tara:strand:- start:5483 stop:5725 length:243 start_codon:yes stop_codon:yes gene_type:complete
LNKTITKKDKKQAFKEAFLDTMLALSMNFPLNIGLVWIAFEFKLGVVATSVFLTAVFTTVAIIRKTYTRLYFLKKTLDKS